MLNLIFKAKPSTLFNVTSRRGIKDARVALFVTRSKVNVVIWVFRPFFVPKKDHNIRLLIQTVRNEAAGLKSRSLDISDRLFVI